MAEENERLVSLLYHCLYNQNVMNDVRDPQRFEGLIQAYGLQNTTAAVVLRRMSTRGGKADQDDSNALFDYLLANGVVTENNRGAFWDDYQRNFPKIW